MNLQLNQIINHKKFGTGKIINIINRENQKVEPLLYVMFNNDEKPFRMFTETSIKPHLVEEEKEEE